MKFSFYVFREVCTIAFKSWLSLSEVYKVAIRQHTPPYRSHRTWRCAVLIHALWVSCGCKITKLLYSFGKLVIRQVYRFDRSSRYKCLSALCQADVVTYKTGGQAVTVQET